MESEVIELIDRGEYPRASELASELSEFNKHYYNGVIAYFNSDAGFGIEQMRHALEICDDSPDGVEKKRLAILHLAWLYQVNNDFNGAEKELEKYEALQPHPNGFEEALYLLVHGAQISTNGEATKGKAEYTKSAELFQSLGKLSYASYSYMFLGISTTGHEKIEYIRKGRELAKKAGNERRYAYMSCFMGHAYQMIGDYNQARVLNQFAYDKSTELNYGLGIANSTMCLGTIGIEEGRIQYAINQLEAVPRKYFEVNRAAYEAASMIFAYRLGLQTKKAYDHALKSLQQFKDLVHWSSLIRALYLQSILASVEYGDIKQAEEFYTELMDKTKSSESPEALATTKLSEGIILKSKRKMRDSLKAREIFYEILEMEDLNNHIVITETTRNLCELLLEEYELYEDQDCLLEIQQLLDKLLERADTQQLNRVRFEISIIQSKVMLLQGDFEESKRFLEKVLKLTEERHLDHFHHKIEQEIKLIEQNFSKWVDLVNNNQSLKSIIDESKIKNYLSMAKQYVDGSEEISESTL